LPYKKAMSELKFACPHCQQPLACDDQFAGRQIACPACNSLTAVPGQPVPPTPVLQKTGMTYIPEDWQKPKPEAKPPGPQKTGLTHVPESWIGPTQNNQPEAPRQSPP
jgi:DNA-directed RNA polymerase subunit RPC12/RpoP